MIRSGSGMRVRTTADCWAAITAVVAAVLEEQGVEAGELSGATMLNADLGITSVEAIHLVIMLEDRLGVQLSFEKLAVRDGEYVEDLSLAELLSFTVASLRLDRPA
jgi:acyl carrier protein